MRAKQLCTTDHPPDQPVSDETPTKEDEAPVPVVAAESADPKPKLSSRIWKKLGFGGAAVTPKKAKMAEERPEEPETVEEIMEEGEEGDDAGSVAIQMEVVCGAAVAPEEEMDVAAEETDLGGDPQQQQQQPRRSLEIIREEQEDEVKVQYANVPHE